MLYSPYYTNSFGIAFVETILCSNYVFSTHLIPDVYLCWKKLALKEEKEMTKKCLWSKPASLLLWIVGEEGWGNWVSAPCSNQMCSRIKMHNLEEEGVHWEKSFHQNGAWWILETFFCPKQSSFSSHSREGLILCSASHVYNLEFCSNLIKKQK